jgi:hypothetical protein
MITYVIRAHPLRTIDAYMYLHIHTLNACHFIFFNTMQHPPFLRRRQTHNKYKSSPLCPSEFVVLVYPRSYYTFPPYSDVQSVCTTPYSRQIHRFVSRSPITYPCKYLLLLKPCLGVLFWLIVINGTKKSIQCISKSKEFIHTPTVASQKSKIYTSRT